MASIGNLVVTISANTKPLVSGLARARAAVTGFAAAAVKGVASLGALVAGAGLLGIATGFVSLAAGVERTAVQFEVLLGSATVAKKLLEDIRQFSIKSPFGMTDLQNAANVLLNFGLTAEQVMPALRFLGDIAAGDTDKLSRLTLAFAQMSAAGRLMGQDLLQMVNAGFNPLQEISKQTGESMIALKKRMEAGGVSSGEVTKAFISATSAGGRFFGMTDRIAQTTIGKWMVLKDQMTLLAIGIGTELLPVANKLLDWASSFVTKLQGIPNVVRGVMASVGTFFESVSNQAQDLRVILATTWEFLQKNSAAVWQDIGATAVASLKWIWETAKTITENVLIAFQNLGKMIDNALTPIFRSMTEKFIRMTGFMEGKTALQQRVMNDMVDRIIGDKGGPQALQPFQALPEFEMPAEIPGVAGMADALEDALAKDRAARVAIGNVPKPGEGPGFDFQGAGQAGAASAKQQQLGAVQAGTAEAYRLIGDILGSPWDPVADAVQEADQNIVAAIGQLGGMMAGLGVSAVIPEFLA